jgi:hypothetical protein
MCPCLPGYDFVNSRASYIVVATKFCLGGTLSGLATDASYIVFRKLGAGDSVCRKFHVCRVATTTVLADLSHVVVFRVNPGLQKVRKAVGLVVPVLNPDPPRPTCIQVPHPKPKILGALYSYPAPKVFLLPLCEDREGVHITSIPYKATKVKRKRDRRGIPAK